MFMGDKVFTVLFILAAISLVPFAGAEDTNAVHEQWELKIPGYTIVSGSSCAVASDGTIYQGTFDGRMFAISPQGQIKWTFKTGRGLEIWSSPAIADDGTVYFGSRDRNFYALAPDGKLKWKFATGAWVDSSPAIAIDGTVYFGSWDKKFYAFTKEGVQKWQFCTSNKITSSPSLAADGTIYFGSHDKHFYALAPNGELKWTFSTGGPIDSSPSIGADGTIYIESTDGYLYALRPDGSEVWRCLTGSYTASSPVIDVDGNLYMASNRYHIVISRDGKLMWAHITDVPMDMSWALTANGMIYLPQAWLSVCAMDRKHLWPPIWYFPMQFNLCTSVNVNPEGIVYASDGAHLYAFKPRNAAPLMKSSWPMWRADPQHNGRVQKLN
jgi:outer membrane protein assembly factor BamB